MIQSRFSQQRSSKQDSQHYLQFSWGKERGIWRDSLGKVGELATCSMAEFFFGNVLPIYYHIWKGFGYMSLVAYTNINTLH